MSTVACLQGPSLGQPTASYPIPWFNQISTDWDLTKEALHFVPKPSQLDTGFSAWGKSVSALRAMSGVGVEQSDLSHGASYPPNRPKMFLGPYSPSGINNVPASHNFFAYNGAVWSPSDHRSQIQSDASNHDDSFRDHASTPLDDVASHLQIPSSINDSRESLAEFAAELTCLFWFESNTIIQRAEEYSPSDSRAVMPLAPDSLPTIGFLKWVTTIWTTTQVTQDVILLALLFIHRLKKFNSSVSGKKGSEYRLLTVALMLANKFLDDNTYTNKTWAEVSGISVSEIHVMEVEFLSNMRYNLYVSQREWKSWFIKLGHLAEYFKQAVNCPVPVAVRPVAAIPSFSQSFPDMLLPPLSPNRHPAISCPVRQPVHPKSNPTAQQTPFSSSGPATPSDYVIGRRKRSPDEDLELPVSKRVARILSATQSPTVSLAASPAAYSRASISGNTGNLKHTVQTPTLRLPVPDGQGPPTSHSQQYCLNPLPLSTARPMPTSYPTSISVPFDAVTPSMAMSSSNSSSYIHPLPNLTEQSKNRFGSIASTSSPLSYGPSTPNQRSPLSALEARKSPYRPLRGVNTLLIPPPLTSYQNIARNIHVEQMQYQPLGKTLTEARTGVVPYLPYNTWSQPWNGAAQPSYQYTPHS